MGPGWWWDSMWVRAGGGIVCGSGLVVGWYVGPGPKSQSNDGRQ